MDKDTIALKLQEKGAVKPCHRCEQMEFSIINGYTNIQLQDDFDGPIVLGGARIPVIHVACQNCGAITSHALGALGMLPKQEAPNGN